MRPVLVADLLMAAADVAAAAPAEQAVRAAELVARADAADRYRKQFGRAHPHWGNGTLLSASRPAPSGDADPVRDLTAMRHVIDAVLARSQRCKARRSQPSRAGPRPVRALPSSHGAPARAHVSSTMIPAITDLRFPRCGFSAILSAAKEMTHG